MNRFLLDLPKVELHLHLEGTLQSDLLFQLAQRNNVSIPFSNAHEREEAYRNVTDLQSFLKLYENELRVLVTSDDFYQLAWAYFQRAAQDHVRHSEVFIDVQAHLPRGVSLQALFDGLRRARQQALTDLHLSTVVIVSFLRDRSEDEALKFFDEVLQYRNDFDGIGLDSCERDHPPSKFVRLYDKAHQHGLHCVAHAGEEGLASYIRQAIELLGVERIDHGIHSVDDSLLLEEIVRRNITLTVCPLSNVKLKAVENIKDLPIRRFLEKKVRFTINSDDPACFGGYIFDNYRIVQESFHLTKEDWFEIARNGIDAAFISKERRDELFKELNNFVESSMGDENAH